jgi:hypothetical protein
MEKHKHVKILFRHYSDMMEQEIIEKLEAEVVDESRSFYKIISIPLYTPFVAVGDVVFAEWSDDEGMLTYGEKVQPSGNSTVWVVRLADHTEIVDIRAIFEELHCLTRSASDRFFAMQVRENINYLKIRDKLNELKGEGLIDYAEPYLSEQHQY